MVEHAAMDTDTHGQARTHRKSSTVRLQLVPRDGSVDRRDELLRNVVALLSMVSDGCSDELMAIYDSVMLRLAEIAQMPVRAETARRLADLRRAPTGIIRHLALDEIEVAQPLLIRSPLLGDQDLCTVAELRGTLHRRAIAARPDLSAPVVAVLVQRGDDGVRRVLAGNVTARIPGSAFRCMLEQAQADPELQELIAARPRLPDEVAATLASFATPRAASLLRRRTRRPRRDPVAPGPDDAERRLRIAALCAGHDFAGAEKRIAAAEKAAALDIAAVAGFSADNRFAEAAVGLARLSGFPLGEVLDWFINCDHGVLLVAVRALGGGEGEFRRLLDAGPWRFRMSARQRGEALRQFISLDADTASAMLARRQAGSPQPAPRLQP
jgi:uncharacterized protein (DUF2336 family)